MSSKTILIGPTGFLGLSFLEKNPDIIAVGRRKIPDNLSNRFVKIETIDDFSSLDSIEFDSVIFLIGSSDHKILNSDPTLAMEKNVLPLSKFLHYLKESNKVIKKVITFTTMLQYDSKKISNPCDENQPKNPYVNNYVLSKYTAEMVSQRYREWLSIIDIRLSNVYGPTPLRRPDLVPTLMWKIIDKQKISVYNKKPKRDFVYVDDVIHAVMALINSDCSRPINLGSGVMRSVHDVCNILSNLSGYEIKDLEKEVSGHYEYCHDLSLVKSITDWTPKYSLELGLEKTYKIMSEMNYE